MIYLFNGVILEYRDHKAVLSCLEVLLNFVFYGGLPVVFLSPRFQCIRSADFETARRLSVRLGFEPCDPVSYHPILGTHFLGCDL